MQIGASAVAAKATCLGGRRRDVQHVLGWRGLAYGGGQEEKPASGRESRLGLVTWQE